MTGSTKCAPIMRMAPKANTESHQTSLSARRNEILVADGRFQSLSFWAQDRDKRTLGAPVSKSPLVVSNHLVASASTGGLIWSKHLPDTPECRL